MSQRHCVRWWEVHGVTTDCVTTWTLFTLTSALLVSLCGVLPPTYCCRNCAVYCRLYAFKVVTMQVELCRSAAECVLSRAVCVWQRDIRCSSIGLMLAGVVSICAVSAPIPWHSTGISTHCQRWQILHNLLRCIVQVTVFRIPLWVSDR